MSERINAIILCRVSTTRQATEWDSLKDQERLCREFCTKNWYNVVNVYKEGETWKIEDREALIKIKKEIADFKEKEWEKIHYLIFLKLDRLTRAGSGAYDTLKKELGSLWTELKDVWWIIQKGRQVIQDRHWVSFANKSWAYDSTPEISEQFQVSMAKIEGNTIIQRTQNSEVDLALIWYNTYKTSYGYKPWRTRDEKKFPIFEKDEIDAPCIKMIFDMRCKWKTDIQIKNKLNLPASATYDSVIAFLHKYPQKNEIINSVSEATKSNFKKIEDLVNNGMSPVVNEPEMANAY